VDGRALEPRKNTRDLMFNPEGTHYAFVSGDQDYPRVVIDGVEQANILAGDLVHYSSSSGEVNHFLFSPDGKHAVYSGVPGSKPGDRYDKHLIADRGPFLDGKILPCEKCGLGTS